MPVATLAAVIEAAAATAPDTPAVVGPDRRDTFAELVSRADALAAFTASRTGPGDVVAILGENSTGYVEALYGVPSAGRRLLLLNYRHHPREWASMLERSAATLVVGDPELLERLAPHISVPLEPLDAALLTRTNCAPAAHPDPGDVAWVVPTSGTTGAPKLAQLTHRSLLTAAPSSCSRSRCATSPRTTWSSSISTVDRSCCSVASMPARRSISSRAKASRARRSHRR
jgi:acyl-CoA synthetase (AMP-forming)/AMP-acid ligase II